MADYLEARGIPVPIAELRTRHGLRMTLDRIAEAGVVTIYDGGTEPVFAISTGRHHVAAFYRNGALHHLLNRAMLEIALLRVGDADPDEDIVEVAWRELARLRDLLKFEFFFSTRREFRAEIIGELDLVDPQWRTRAADPADVRGALRQAPLLVAPGVLRSFFDAQLVVADRLVALGEEPMTDEKEFLEDCLGVGRQMLLQQRVDRADSVSRELYATAVRQADNRDLLREPESGAAGAPLADRRAAWLTEVTAVIHDLGRLGELQRARLEVVLGSGETTTVAASAAAGAVVPPAGAQQRAEGDSGVAS